MAFSFFIFSSFLYLNKILYLSYIFYLIYIKKFLYLILMKNLMMNQFFFVLLNIIKVIIIANTYSL